MKSLRSWKPPFITGAALLIGWRQQHSRCGLLRFRPDGRVLLLRQKDETTCADVRPDFVGFLRSGVVVWVRADAPSLAQRRSTGIHAGRPTPRHLHSASRRAFGGVSKIVAREAKSEREHQKPKRFPTTPTKNPAKKRGSGIAGGLTNQLPLTALPFTVPSCSMMLYSLPSVSTCCRRTSR